VEEENCNSDFIEMLDSLVDKEGGAASIRWALSARAGGMFDIELQFIARHRPAAPIRDAAHGHHQDLAEKAEVLAS
jgi:hypothetical protein